ncbi:MAG TPA: hypothetical protein PLC16_11240 [Defluviitaleaceae bacterium]|nr:hypothetical protein [Defluviitaleaceae bacterium]
MIIIIIAGLIIGVGGIIREYIKAKQEAEIYMVLFQTVSQKYISLFEAVYELKEIDNPDGTKTFIYDVKDKLKEFLPELKADIGHNHNKTKITEMLTDEIIKYIKKQTSCNTGTGNDNN